MRFSFLLAAALCAFVVEAQAQQPWPAKPVRLVVANSTGAATDVAARVFAGILAGKINQPVAVENRPGGDGLIGAQAVVSAPPDGYTLFFASQSTTAIDPHLKKNMPFDPVKDFTPIAVMLDDTGPTAIFAHPSMPFSSLPGLIDYAKANPGKLTYATTVPLFSMLGEWIEKRGGIKMTEVRYKTTPQATQDTLAGTTTLYITAYGPMVQHLKAGRLKVLAVTLRQQDIADIPTVAETFPGFSMLGSISLLGPAGMQAETVQRINAASDQAVRDPQFNQQLKALRWQNNNGARTPQGTAEFIRASYDRWGKFIAEIGRKPE